MKFEDRYSRLDRAVHRLAFSTIEIQKGLADIEDRVYAKRIAALRVDRPVFIAALPRAGTTLLLDALASTGAFATHTYRHMPFVMMPMLWRALSGRFHAADAAPFERAHGDGMLIGYDSPEAFEEIIWRAFWREKYRGDRIIPWNEDDADAHNEFEPFFKSHILKIAAIRYAEQDAEQVSGKTSARRAAPPRYASKNNMNISRVPKIAKMFPDAAIIILFRNPVDHAASMLRQHLNFQRIHGEEAFARRYMRDIGHYDFGANFRPIDFGGWLRSEPTPQTDTIDFWLRYWRAAYDHILDYIQSNPNGGVILVSYDNCCADPASALRAFADAVGISASPDAAAADGLGAGSDAANADAPDVGSDAIRSSAGSDAAALYTSSDAANADGLGAGSDDVNGIDASPSAARAATAAINPAPNAAAALLARAPDFRAPNRYAPDALGASPDAIHDALAVHRRLLANAAV